MNEYDKKVYHLIKGDQLSNGLLGMNRFELWITDANGNKIGTIDPEYMFCGVVVYPGAVESLIVNEWGKTCSYGDIKDWLIEFYEKGKFFGLSHDDIGCMHVFFNDIKFEEYGRELLNIHSDNTVNHHEINNPYEDGFYNDSSNIDYNESYPLSNEASFL